MAADARDELVDVIAEAVRRHSTFVEKDTEPTEYGYAICVGCGERRGDASGIPHLSRAVLAALVDVYGEPEIEEDRCSEPDCYERGHNPARRLVFPWKAVKEGQENGR